MNTMMSFSPAILGLVVVVQAGLNRKISAQWGLTAAVLLNAIVFLILAAAIYSLSLWKSDLLPNQFKSTLEIKNFSWWFLIPGVLGCILVFGGPWAIGKWGAVQTFILIISAQLLASLVWDFYVEGLPMAPLRIGGIVLAWFGALLVCLS